MIRRLSPERQREIPVLFLIYLATIAITFVCLYVWITGGFHMIPGRLLVSLWLLVIFLNFWESFFETGEDQNIRHEDDEDS